MLIKPRFFDDFACKAADCKRTCCAGWEIYVDDETAGIYDKLLSDDEKKKLIATNEGILLCREKEKCGFLRSDGLCELILRHGDGILCDICREHPRFYSYSENSSICEAGVGISCEAAAKLWLSADPEFIRFDDGYEPDESELLRLHEQTELICGIFCGRVKLPEFDYYDLRRLYRRMETLEKLDFCEDFEFPAESTAARRLAAYYVYRWYFEYPEGALDFAAANAMMTLALQGELIENAGRLSNEVEYDPDNTKLIIEGLKKVRIK